MSEHLADKYSTREGIASRFNKYVNIVRDLPVTPLNGKVKEVIGSLVVSEGPNAKVGDVCKIYTSAGNAIDCEVIGMRGEDMLLASYSHLTGITYGDRVVSFERPLEVMCCDEMLGKVLNGMGNMLDGTSFNFFAPSKPVLAEPTNALLRPRISEPIQTGVRTIDGLLTVGKGQRVAIMSGTGVGKSSLLSMIARNTDADVNVISLVGERRREVLDFIERDLGKEGLKKSVLVIATSDEAPLMRLRSVYVATAIAEYFRDQGKDVMLMVDSVTRFALAQREIGLSRGEPTTTRGYTPSVFSELAQLLERSGTSERGSITAFYNVLVEGDDFDEPISDAVRGILDGHIVLSRTIAQRGVYPAIDINQSISRLASELASERHSKSTRKFVSMSAAYNEARELIMIGGYAKGSMPEVDEAIHFKPIMDRFLQQGVNDAISFLQSKVDLLSMFYSQYEIDEEMSEYEVDDTNTQSANTDIQDDNNAASEEDNFEVFL